LRLLDAQIEELHEGLRANRWGERVRLEQERVAWPAALEAISNALGIHL
jgi:hypothetical protein